MIQLWCWLHYLVKSEAGLELYLYFLLFIGVGIGYEKQIVIGYQSWREKKKNKNLLWLCLHGLLTHSETAGCCLFVSSSLQFTGCVVPVFAMVCNSAF